MLHGWGGPRGGVGAGEKHLVVDVDIVTMISLASVSHKIMNLYAIVVVIIIIIVIIIVNAAFLFSAHLVHQPLGNEIPRKKNLSRFRDKQILKKPHIRKQI
jgi:hypothetical protein